MQFENALVARVCHDLITPFNAINLGVEAFEATQDAIMLETIKESTMCDATISNSECFYNFRDKYRDLPYLAYKI